MTTLFVLAAGLGSRFGGLKQMKAVGPSGESLLEYSVYDAIQAGFDKVCFLVRPEMEEEFRSKLISRFEDKIECSIAYQSVDALPPGAPLSCLDSREKVWGTGHALWCARKELSDPFAVINADDFYGRASYKQLADFLSSGSGKLEAKNALHSMVGFHLSETLSESGPVSRGLCNVIDSHLVTVQECLGIERVDSQIISTDPKSSWEGSQLVSMNCWGLFPSIFEELESELEAFFNSSPGPKAEFYLPSFMQSQIDKGNCKVQVLETNAKWFGMTYPQDLELVTEKLLSLCQENEYPSSLWGN